MRHAEAPVAGAGDALGAGGALGPGGALGGAVLDAAAVAMAGACDGGEAVVSHAATTRPATTAAEE